jgi:F-type H+-transporting ATPase subunit a
MYPEIFYSNTFTLLAEAEVGKHFYWSIGGALVHGQVLVVIWFVVSVLIVHLYLELLMLNEFHMVFKTLWNQQ